MDMPHYSPPTPQESATSKSTTHDLRQNSRQRIISCLWPVRFLAALCSRAPRLSSASASIVTVVLLSVLFPSLLPCVTGLDFSSHGWTKEKIRRIQVLQWNANDAVSALEFQAFSKYASSKKMPAESSWRCCDVEFENQRDIHKHIALKHASDIGVMKEAILENGDKDARYGKLTQDKRL